MKIHFPEGKPAKLTPAQRKSLKALANFHSIPTDPMVVHPVIGGQGAVMVQAQNGLWIGVESDGYSHT
jgi:hypothetical protein